MTKSSRGLLGLCVPLFLLTLSGCGGGVSSGDVAAGPASTAPSAPTAVQVRDGATADVQEAFDIYTEAALARDGERATAVLASPVHRFYDEARHLALSATADELHGLSPTTQITVYVFRAEVDPELLRSGSVTELLTEAFVRGLIGEQAIDSAELGSIEVDGDTASAEVFSDGEEIPYRFQFLREDEVWKVDIGPIVEIADETFTMMAEQQDIPVEQFVEDMLVQQYGPEEAAALANPLDG
ncbi:MULTISPECIES: hypothetical protein [Actinoalloteichus]|uniref:Lipoprotein n=1 Tax=Actinoalloteichus fjordicus TaxID=1612552 RepID=A0AAC9LEA3_9PSEU|nr:MULTISPECIES: hypothetical protein [Actinoalloteichus]APU16368.1 hypothetical protein UA74_21730 [Actinoalloteichus fjordicus]APU22426.1 hypothetical protein UA75_22200 [Actinoalloteichus sp. GBA129-24]